MCQFRLCQKSVFFNASCPCCFIRKVIKGFWMGNFIRLHGEVVISWKSYIVCLYHNKVLTGLPQCLGWLWNTCKRRIRRLLLSDGHISTQPSKMFGKQGNRGQNWRGQDMGQHSTGAHWRETQNNLCSVSKSCTTASFWKDAVQRKSHTLDERNN